MIENINNVCNKSPFEICPVVNSKIKLYEDYDSTFDMMWYSSSQSGDYDNDIKELILSRYPILSSKIVNLHENTENKIIEKNKILIANINIEGYVISVLNVTLFGDSIGGMSGSKFRKTEVDEIKSIINSNNEEVEAFIKTFKMNLVHKKITLIAGLYNINEIKNDKINTELVQTLKDLNSVDILRLLSSAKKENNSGINNTLNTRDCYICLHMHNHKDSEQYLQPNDVIKKIYDEYGLTFVSSYILKTYKILDYYPIELIFILDRKEKVKLKI